CKLNGDVATPGDYMPPVWDTTVGITSVVPGENQIAVIWGTATDSMTPPVEYLVYIDTDENPWDTSPVIKPTNDPHAFANLDNGTKYWCGVRCMDSADPPNVDDNIVVISATPEEGLVGLDITPPVWDDTVGVVSVVPWDKEVTVYWGTATDDQSPPVEYLVYKDTDSNPWDQEPVIRTNNDPYTFSALQNGEEYWFGVRCRDNAIPRNIDANNVFLSAIPEEHGWVRTWAASYPYCVATDSSGNAYILLNANAGTDLDPGPGSFILPEYSISLCKLNANGEFLWATSWPELHNFDPTSMAVDAGGNVIFWGILFSAGDLDPGEGVDWHNRNGQPDAFILKLDTQGNFLWAYSFGLNGFDRVSDLIVTSSGYIYSIGILENIGDAWSEQMGHYNTFMRMPFLKKFNPDGELEWTETWDEVEDPLYSNTYIEAHCVAVDSFENIYVCGDFRGSNDFQPGPGVDFQDSTTTNSYLMKFDSSGDFSQSLFWGGSDGETSPSQIVVDSKGKLRIAGTFSGSADFDPGAGQYIKSAAGLSGSYISSINPLNGDYLGVITWGGAGETSVSTWQLGTDGDGNILVAGGYHGTVDFDPGPGVNELTSSDPGVSGTSFYVSKFDSDDTYLWTIAPSIIIEGFAGLAVEPSGRFFVACNTWENNLYQAYLAKFFPSGTL
ncbi:MAG: hypothetical protein NTY09_02140, partial [bacterium]|nr:hypothetical protein [bacterium]